MFSDSNVPDLPGNSRKTVQRVLIVDDRYDNRYLLQALLEGNGYQTISAENGLDALNKLKTEIVDAIISDILMPEMDGFKLCRVIRENPAYAHLPFIFYTASYTEAKDRDFGLSLGADEYVIKPIEPGEFMVIVRKVFSRSESEEESTVLKSSSNHLSFYVSYSDIIEKKLNKKLFELDQHREAIRFSEEKYQHFYKILQGIGYLFQVGNELPLSFEGPVEEITGYSELEFQNGTWKWQDLLHPGDKERYLTERSKAESRSGNNLSIQYRIIHKNGEIRWVHETASVFSGRHPETIMIQGAIYDNTLQVKLDEQVRISEAHYRFLFETMVEGAVYQDKNGVIIDANLSAERILGLTRDQLLGRESRDPRWKAIREDFSAFPGEDHPAMVTLRTGERTSAIMGVFNPRDTQYHWILAHAVPIFHPEEKNSIQVLTTFEDITQEHLAKNALDASEKKYRRLIECISNTLFTLDKDGICTYVSPVVRKIFGFDPIQLIGHHYLEFVCPDDHEKMNSWFGYMLENKVMPVEFRGFNAEHQIRYLQVMASPVQDGDTIVEVSGIMSDITIWKENEKIKTDHTREIQGLLTLHLLCQESEEHIFSFALDVALDITDSRMGFIAFVRKSDQKFFFHIWSPQVMESCRVMTQPDLCGMSDSEILSECRLTKKPVIINDFSLRRKNPVFSQGHLPVNRLLVVPVLENDQVVAIMAVANKTDPYSESQVISLNTLGNTLWNIINRKWADREINIALYQIAKNMEQLATLNDTIRNPLSIIAAISDLIDPQLRKAQLGAVRNIDSVISMLDQGWIQSEKVRQFLMKHYQFTKNELDYGKKNRD
jgi:PAS domain S-box-containing protein